MHDVYCDAEKSCALGRCIHRRCASEVLRVTVSPKSQPATPSASGARVLPITIASMQGNLYIGRGSALGSVTSTPVATGGASSSPLRSTGVEPWADINTSSQMDGLLTPRGGVK